MRAFPVRLPSGARYWTVLDEDLAVVPVADGSLRQVRFGRDGAEATTKIRAFDRVVPALVCPDGPDLAGGRGAAAVVHGLAAACGPGRLRRWRSLVILRRARASWARTLGLVSPAIRWPLMSRPVTPCRSVTTLDSLIAADSSSSPPAASPGSVLGSGCASSGTDPAAPAARPAARTRGEHPPLGQLG
jgi:hypothetical protein